MERTRTYASSGMMRPRIDERLTVQTIPGHSLVTAAGTAIRHRPSRRVLLHRGVAHTILLLSANLLAGLCIYLMHSVLGHILGPTAYGTLAALLALSSILLIPTHVIAALMTRHGSALRAAGRVPQLNDLMRRLTMLLLPIGLGVMVLFMGVSGPIAAFFHLDASRNVLLLGLLFTVSFVTPINIGALLGLQCFVWYSALMVLPVFLRLALASAFVVLGYGMSGAICGIVLADVLTYIVSFQPLHSILRGPRSSCGSLRPFWISAAQVSIVFIGTGMLSNVDTLLAKHVLSVPQAGMYAALATAGKTLFFVSGVVVTVMFPRFAALHSRGEQATQAILRAVIGVCALALPVELVFAAFPTLVMQVMFGPSYVAVAGQLVWYGLAMLLFALAVVFVYYFLAIGEQRVVLPLLACCLAQGSLFAWRHASIAQLVQNVVISNSLLLLGLLAFVSWYMRRRRVG